MPALLRLRDNGPQWPYSVAQFRADEPRLSISDNPHEGELASYATLEPPIIVCRVRPTDPPEHDPSAFQAREVTPVEVDGVWQQAWKLIEMPPAPPLPPAPNWPTFKGTALSHPALNAAIAAAIPTAPAAALALPAALLRAEQGDPGDFRGCWRAVCAAAPVAPETVAELVALAEKCHLPADFVQALQPAQAG